FDLTNPACFEWVKSIIKEKLTQKAGLSGWMSDYGEYLPLDAALHSEEDPAKIHNIYPVLFAKANYEAIQELGLENEVTFFSRAGFTGTSKYSPLIWAGDQVVSWDRQNGIGSVIPAALSLGMCGIGYHHSDIGGFINLKRVTRSKELLLRWTELCAFSILMRSHEGLQPEENWQLDSDEETLTHLARMTQIHVILKPYLQHCAQEYQKSGIPVIRAPVLYFSKDP
ncbi:MAG: alpha-glucosidase, partial [Promethearchaeota archaeon]